MGNKKYSIESDFDDLHGNPADEEDLELDLESDNPIIQAAKNSDSWTPPDDDDDDDEKGESKDDDEPGDLSDDEPDFEDLEDLTDDEDVIDKGDEEEEDDEKYSKNVKKRIDRERDARKRDREASDRRIAKLERQNDLMIAQSKYSSDVTAAESKLTVLKEKKVEALDEDDTKAVVDIDDQILDIKADLKTKKAELTKLEANVQKEADDDGAGSPPPTGLKWLAKYPQFHTNKKFNRAVLLADNMVSDRGFDKNEEEYYEEIERILAPQWPEIVKIAKKRTKQQANSDTARRKRKSAVGSPQRAGTRNIAGRRNTIRLTKDDQHQMQVFGLDPKNPVDVKHWAANAVGK